MLPILQLGPVAIPVPAFSYLLAFWLGISLAEKLAKNHGQNADALYNLVFTGLIAGLAGARLIYIIQYPGAFLQSPASIVSLNPGLLDPFGGAAFGLIGMLVFGQRAKMGFALTLDALTPMLAVILAGMGVAHIAAGDAYGSITNLPWAINLWGANRHPTQFYELGLALPILAAAARPQKPGERPGARFLWFTVLASGAQLFLFAFRGDSTLLGGGLRLEQLIAWGILAAALACLNYLDIQNKRKGNDLG